MPGPVSDAYDPEFGTGENAYDVRCEIEKITERISALLGPDLKDIVRVVHGEPGVKRKFYLTEKELRVIRFGLLRSMESV